MGYFGALAENCLRLAYTADDVNKTQLWVILATPQNAECLITTQTVIIND